MCYMTSHERVGVRELRQNLSVYLRRIVEGHSFEVTDRGQPVALLVPLATADTPLSRLIAAGRASAPQGDLLELGPPTGAGSAKVSDALRDQRGDRP